MKRVMTGAIAMLGLVVLGAVGAWADSIGPVCLPDDTCAGNVFQLRAFQVDVGTTTTELDVVYQIDTGSTTLASTDVIRDIAFKVTSSTSDVVNVTLLGFFDGLVSQGTAAWSTPIVGGLNSNGCGAGSEGFICTADADAAPTDGSTWTWVFHLEVLNGQLLPGLESTVKARYCVTGTDCEGVNFQGLTSEHIGLQPGVGPTPFISPTSVPEPASMVLLGAGLLSLAVGARSLSSRK
jgi:PEP-CTERM motif